MSQPQILIVDSNRGRVQQLRDAMTTAMLPAPIHREDGESAVLWIGANDCDLCILSYELSGINGLETLARMRNRRPDLQGIIIAETDDQAVAIAAFRAGVSDFVPARGDFARVVAEKAQNLLGVHGTESRATPSASTANDPTLDHIPRERLAPTYQNRLRSIGRQLDVYGYHTVTILEIAGGFLVRAQRQRSRKPQALEFADRDFPRLVASAIQEELSESEKPIRQRELIPTGYEDVLRALGHRMDTMSAESLVITELDDKLVVGGRGNDEKSAVPGMIQFHYLLEQPDIEYMLNEAFHRRGHIQPKLQRPSTQQGGLRGILRRLN